MGLGPAGPFEGGEGHVALCGDRLKPLGVHLPVASDHVLHERVQVLVFQIRFLENNRMIVVRHREVL